MSENLRPYAASMRYLFKPGKAIQGLDAWERIIAEPARRRHGLQSLRVFIRGDVLLALGTWDKREDAQAFMHTGVFTRLMAELENILADTPAPELWEEALHINKETDSEPLASAPKAPPKFSFLLRPMLKMSEKKAKRELPLARRLLWTPLLAIVAAFFELGVEAESKKLGKRLSGLLRLRVSYTLACPFCIVQNSAALDGSELAEEVRLALAARRAPPSIPSLTKAEQLALQYADALCSTPLRLENEVLEELTKHYKEKDLVRMAVLISKVNFFARMVQGLGLGA